MLHTKKDYPYDCAKHTHSYVTEGGRRDPQPCNRWTLFFLKKHKGNIHRLHSCWGMSHPKGAGTPRRTGSRPIKKKIRSPVTNRFGIKIPHNAREVLTIGKENNNTLWD